MRIEPALSAWERSRQQARPASAQVSVHLGCSVSDRESPYADTTSGTCRARWPLRPKPNPRAVTVGIPQLTSRVVGPAAVTSGDRPTLATAAGFLVIGALAVMTVRGACRPADAQAVAAAPAATSQPSSDPAGTLLPGPSEDKKGPDRSYELPVHEVSRLRRPRSGRPSLIRPQRGVVWCGVVGARQRLGLAAGVALGTPVARRLSCRHRPLRYRG